MFDKVISGCDTEGKIGFAFRGCLKQGSLNGNRSQEGNLVLCRWRSELCALPKRCSVRRSPTSCLPMLN